MHENALLTIGLTDQSGYSICILYGQRFHPYSTEKNAPMQWNTKAENITTNIKVNIDSTLPALSAANVVVCNFHVDDSAKGRYDMILGRDLLI